jgi:hypothetical protein
MKNILVVLNGRNTAETVFFACYIAGFTQARLIAIFPHEMPYLKEPAIKQVHGSAYVESIVEADLPVDNTYAEKVQEQQQLFSEKCESRGIPYHLFKDQQVRSEQLMAESRFADMIIVDTSADVQQHEEQRNKLSRLLLANSECPVIIAPAAYDPVEEIIFCYDGSASAVFAMKQLTYLLPGLENIKAIALHVETDNKLGEAGQNTVRKWLSDNYRHWDVQTIKGPAEKELLNFLLRKKTLVVMGAYGRGIISRFFHQSMAEQLVDLSLFPVFITH